MAASRFWTTAFAVALVLIAGHVPAQDAGAPAIDPKSPPWSAIGRVNRFGGEFCTGALIGPRHVLTAAHCLYDGDRRQWVDAGDLQFVAGYHRGDFAAHALVGEFIVPPAFRPELALTPENLANDWAILVLSSSVGVRPIAWLPMSPGELAARTGDRTALMRVGYSREQAHVMTAHIGCSLAVMVGRLLTHDCAPTLNDSGSPLLLRRNGQLTLVGITVATQIAGLSQLGTVLPIDGFAGDVNRALGSQ